MEAKAIVRFAPYSARKVGQVLNLIRKKPVIEANKILEFLTKAPAKLIKKTLNSAVANAGRLKRPEGLYIKECWASQGPAAKRFRARAFGRAVTYKRKSCHLTIVVTDSMIK